MSRTSTGRPRLSPIRRTTRSSSTRRRKGWISSGSSPISSRQRTPPSASSRTPGLPSRVAGEGAGDMAEQLGADEVAGDRPAIESRRKDHAAPRRPPICTRRAEELLADPGLALDEQGGDLARLRDAARDVDRLERASLFADDQRRLSRRTPAAARAACPLADLGVEGRSSAAPRRSPSSVSGRTSQARRAAGSPLARCSMKRASGAGARRPRRSVGGSTGTACRCRRAGCCSRPPGPAGRRSSARRCGGSSGRGEEGLEQAATLLGLLLGDRVLDLARGGRDQCGVVRPEDVRVPREIDHADDPSVQGIAE